MRLFVAVELPWTVRETLSGLCGGLPGARWAAPATLHLTLRFIGEVPNPVADEIDEALAMLRGKRFALALAGVGLFERGRSARTLWVGLARDDRLFHLQARVETALQRVGLAADKRRFVPHVSLGRVDSVAMAAVAGWVQAHNLLRTEPIEIDAFGLYSSQPGPDQPVYIVERDYALG